MYGGTFALLAVLRPSTPAFHFVFYRFSTLDVTYVKKCTRPSPLDRTASDEKLGVGLGTRLANPMSGTIDTSTDSTIYMHAGTNSKIPDRCVHGSLVPSAEQVSNSHLNGNESISLWSSTCSR